MSRDKRGVHVIESEKVREHNGGGGEGVHVNKSFEVREHRGKFMPLNLTKLGRTGGGGGGHVTESDNDREYRV